MASRDHDAASLPMPPWMTGHGETYDEWAGNVRCRRHFTHLGQRGSVIACKHCVREAREHERATRDD